MNHTRVILNHKKKKEIKKENGEALMQREKVSLCLLITLKVLYKTVSR